MSKPLIGLSTYRELARWGVWDTTADLLPATYARSIELAGGVPVLLPPTGQASGKAAEAVVGRIDGLVITGGADVAPQQYDEEPHPQTLVWREDRDAWETALLRAAHRRSIPVLGICRGMQVMAVEAGGKLEQHLPDRVGHETHSPGGDAFGRIRVRLAPESLLAELVGGRLTVSCHHHQAVLTHPGFEPVAWAEDGTVEAMESTDDRFSVAVQWHPEMLKDAGLFVALVRAAS